VCASARSDSGRNIPHSPNHLPHGKAYLGVHVLGLVLGLGLADRAVGSVPLQFAPGDTSPWSSGRGNLDDLESPPLYRIPDGIPGYPELTGGGGYPERLVAALLLAAMPFVLTAGSAKSLCAPLRAKFGAAVYADHG